MAIPRRSSERLLAAGIAGAPAAVIATVAVADLLVRRSVVLGLVVIAPLLAANLVGPRLTAGYGVLALAVGAVLGIPDELYAGGDEARGQLIRLVAIALSSVVAVIAAEYREDRERRLTRLTTVAEAAQRAILLPVPERIGAARVAVHYASAATDALIGGDMHALVDTPYGLRVLIGDVRGKGLGAVGLSAQVLAAFRERANEGPDLSALLDALDRTVHRAAQDDEDFVTAAVVQLTPDGCLTVVTAGHPMPFVLSGGRARLLHGPARPPLGLPGNAVPVVLSLDPGDRVLLYTDGLTEAREPAGREPSQRGWFPEQSVLGALATDLPAVQVLDLLVDQVVSWTGGALGDDLALVLLEYAPTPQPEPAAVTPAGTEHRQAAAPTS